MATGYIDTCDRCDGPRINGAPIERRGDHPDHDERIPIRVRSERVEGETENWCRACIRWAIGASDHDPRQSRPGPIDGHPIERHDSVRVLQVERFTERGVPYTGRVVEILDDGRLCVTDDDDDRSPDIVAPQHAERVFDSEAEACAFLAAREMETFTVAGSRGSNVWAFTGEGGYNFSNIGRAIDMDHAEAGPVEAYNDRVQEKAPEWAEVYVNYIVRGLRDPDEDGWGYGLPTHSSGKRGAVPRPLDEIDPWVRLAAEAAGIDLSDHPKTRDD